ncbi:MAG: tetratricopeptide repeat protein, partial [Syntrophales bacterium]|nr:tetratricopeptide repeat protein [Syntrophales bacterium]
MIYHVIGDLIHQGVSVYLLDHRSTDNTVIEASKWLGKGLLHIETFPDDSHFSEENKAQYIWRDILKRKTELAAQLDADWFIHADADEFRESPWSGLTLREAFYIVDRLGYNAIDFELLNFRPVDNSFVPGKDVREFLHHYEAGEDYNTRQVKAWKNLHVPVDLVTSGGHDILFEGRNVFPIRFIHRHYPIRSQQHGLQKVFRQRKNRFCETERSMAWHIQYDHILDETHDFIHDPAKLTRYNAEQVRTRLLTGSGRLQKDDSRTLEVLAAAGYDTDKSPRYLANYERYFLPFIHQSVCLLELGVFRGGSLYLWRDFFNDGCIVGLDTNAVSIDDPTGRIRFYQGLQQDTELLDRIRRECAPDGFDVIIDDASHVGELTRVSFWHLFEYHLKPGGLYVIEDWGTGYWDSFPDGKSYTPGNNHSAGMVGFVKELVDECGMRDITHPQLGRTPQRDSRIERLEVCSGQIFVVKKRTPLPPCRTRTETIPRPSVEPATDASPAGTHRRDSRSNGQYHRDTAAFYCGKGSWDEARGHFEQAVSLEPENSEFRKNLADYCYVVMKRPDAAVRHYEKALSLNPRDTETLLILGNIRAESGDFLQARECYLGVLEIEPSNEMAGKMFDALEARAEEAGTRDSETLVREARCLARRGRTDRAVHRLETLLSNRPDHAAAHNDLGNLYCLLKNPDKALLHLERAAQLAPEEIGFLRDLADAHLAEAGNLQQALALYNKALALQPDDIETLLRIGNVCAAQNRFDDARYFYDRVLAVRPDHPQAKENLAVLHGMAAGGAAGADSESCPVCSGIAHRAVTRQDHPYYACTECRAVFTPSIDPKVLVTENQGSEGRHTPEMDGARLSHLAYKAPFTIETVVDFGCGNGEYGRFLASRGIECLNIDQDTTLQLRDVPDESVDGINMVEVIEHLYDPIAYFKEFHRVLKPGGRLYVESSFVNGQDLERWEYLSPAIGHCLVQSERSLALLARRFDFGLHRFNAHCYLFVKPLDARKPDGPTGHAEPQAAVADMHARPASPERAAASASIIIPVFNQVHFTSRCLETLYAHTPLDRVHEVIVVDNASSDGTGAFLEKARKRYPKLKVLSNRENLLFARACNQGADIAGGDVLVFLNNDTEPLPGWLDRALERLDRDDSIGAVGVKLLFPDGTVQHCGIQFFRNAHPSYAVWPLHRHLHAAADAPPVNVPGDMDAVTGACLFIRSRLFKRIGGFEERYGMYFEDTDLCFKVRRAGRRVFYEPASVVIHHEGKSSPTRDVIHALNETSARRFFKTWKEDLIRFELDTLVEQEEGRYAYLPQNFWPEEVCPEAIVRIHALLSNFPPCYVHFGGAGDALLLLSTFYDKDPEQTVVSVSNSTGMMRSFFDAFPKLKKVIFIPFPKNYTWHFIARQFFKSSDTCLGMGATPTTTADYREWNADLDIFTTYGIRRRPEWAVLFDKCRIEPVQLVIQPRGSLKGMVGSKRNVIPPKDWPRLLSFLAKKGIRPVIIGTPDEAEEYPCLDKAVDRRSYSFVEQLQLIAGSDFFVGADSWGKTFAALAGIPTFVFHAVRGNDLKGWKDASDHVFLDPWDEITVVKDLNDFRWAFDAARPDRAAVACDLKIRWEGSQFVHHSLALVNRELCSRLIEGGCELSIIPYERDQFSPKEEPRFKPIADRIRKPLTGPADVHVRHQWPPDFNPPPEGHWVMIQPWEFGSLPREWVRPMSEQVDELWVPSRYVRDCYIRSGVPAERVTVVPNGVNTDLFNPGNAPYRLKTNKAFKFLFVGGTIQRKGIDVLLDVYTRSFSSADDVCLVIKDMGGQSFYKGQTAKEWIRRFQNDPSHPEIEYIEHNLSDREIAGLYTACDCLVHPYRGEGFGLPIAEAMASELPVIVTGHGAALDFCNETIAYLIPAKEGRLPEKRVGEFETVDFPWLAEPDREGLARLMRHTAANREEAAAKGRLAAQFIRSHFTWDHAAEAVKTRVRELRGKPILRLRQNDEASGQERPALKASVKQRREATARHEGPAGGAGVSVSPALAKADDLYQRGNLRAATEAYLSAIKATPWDRECYLSMAEMLIQTKHYKEAQDLLGAATLGSPDARMLSLLGSIREGLGDDGEAGRLAAQALERTPRFAPALNLQGVLAFKNGNRGDAERLFREAAKADPSWGEPLTNLGVLHWAAGEKEKSLELLETGFALSPGTADLAERYHAAAVSLGLHARAEKAFRDAGGRHPQNRTIAFLLIDLLISQEKHEEAMARIEAAMASFEADDGFIDAALAVRGTIGPMEIDRGSDRPTLSLCMIVKNEQASLVRCLASVKAAVDEMIVVDTGSADRTKDLAS